MGLIKTVSIVILLVLSVTWVDSKALGPISPRHGRQFSNSQASAQSFGGFGGGNSFSSAQSSSVGVNPGYYGGLGGGFNQYGGQMGGYGYGR